MESKGIKVTDAKIAAQFQENTGERISRRRVQELRSGGSGGNLPKTPPETAVWQEADATGRSAKAIQLQRKLLKVRPDLYDSVVAGSLTLNAACVAAGIVKNPGPLEKILKLLPKLSIEEIQQLKKKMSELE